MKLFDSLDVGVATHTGRVRTSNEDDYLVYVPQEANRLQSEGSLFVIADGMGGMSGGGEASRAAVRALAGALQRSAGNGHESDRRESLRSCFSAAAAEVHRLAQESPGLRDMGTTLTAVNLVGQDAWLGHVGDTRCMLVRDGAVRQLTEDHAVRSAEQYLTRCIGAGQHSVEADVMVERVEAGDYLVLLTDGAWSTLRDEDLARVLRSMPVQAAAEEIVRRANLNGGLDNATALVIHVERLAGDSMTMRRVDLPAEEIRHAPHFEVPDARLVAPRWPWVLLVLAGFLLVLGLARLVFERDLLRDLLDLLR